MEVLPKPGSEYFFWLKEWAIKNSDGCTKSRDWNLICCWQHDFGLQMGFDPRFYYKNELVVIGKYENAKLFLKCNMEMSRFHKVSVRSWIRFLAVASPFGGNTDKRWWVEDKDESSKQGTGTKEDLG